MSKGKGLVSAETPGNIGRVVLVAHLVLIRTFSVGFLYYCAGARLYASLSDCLFGIMGLEPHRNYAQDYYLVPSSAFF